MQIVTFDEREIEITSVYFRSSPNNKRLETFPKRMVYEGREYTFAEDGWRYLVKKGQDFVKLFDMNDGEHLYRLRLEHDDRWTLVGMKSSV